MPKPNLLDVILTTINDVQQKNAANPRQPTADPSIFDLLRGKMGELDQKSRDKRASKGKTPESIFDMIRNEIEGTRKENKKDTNVPTAPDSIFDNLFKKLDDRPNRRANNGLRRIVEEYNLDVSRLPKELLRQVQQKYTADQKGFDQRYARAINDLIRKH